MLYIMMYNNITLSLKSKPSIDEGTMIHNIRHRII